MKVKIWNQQDSINGVTLEEILSYRDDIVRAIERDEKILLVCDDFDNVKEIAFEYYIRSVLGVDVDINDICDIYLDYVNKRDEKQPDPQDDLSAKIDILQAENNRLKEVEKEQDKIIIDIAYNISNMQTNLGGI